MSTHTERRMEREQQLTQEKLDAFFEEWRVDITVITPDALEEDTWEDIRDVSLTPNGTLMITLRQMECADEVLVFAAGAWSTYQTVIVSRD